MMTEQEISRFNELKAKAKAACPGCAKDSTPVELSGSWFHAVNPDGTYASGITAAGMTQPCAASEILTEMQRLRAH